MPAPADPSAAPPNGSGSPDRYRAILHHGQQGFGLVEVLFDAQGAAVDFRVLEVNAAFERQTGLAGPVGRTLRELAPGHGAEWFARYGQVARTGQPQQFEQQVPHGAGRWFEVQALPGGPAGSHQVAILLADTTARHQAEAAQQHSSQLLLDMEAVARTGSYAADLTSGSFYFSDGLYRLFGEAPQAFAVTLEAIDARSHPDDVAPVRRVLDEAVRTKQPYTYRRRIRRADGEWRTMEAHGEVRTDATGHAVQLRGLVQDVTERVQAEQALHASRQLLRATIDSSLDMVQVFEAVRDEQGAVVDFTWVLNNAAAERYYGDVLGQRLCQLNPGVVEEGIFDTFQEVLATGVPDQSERHYRHEQFDGWFYQSTVRLGDGVTTTTHDIRARKRLEQELRESKTLLQDIIDTPNIGLAVYRAVRNEAGEVVDFTHEYINRASREMLGEDFTGRLFTDHGENGHRQLAQLREVLATGRRNSYLRETDFRGRRVWFAISNTPLDGERLVHTWEDVTERQQAEAEILRLKDELAQQATDKYHALFRSMDQGFCVLEILFDATGQRAVGFKALEVNPRFAQESGMAAYAAGNTPPELVPALDDFWLAAYGQVVRTGEAHRQERYEPRVNRWFDVHAFRIGPPAAHQVAVLFTDISARKQVEQQLRAAAEAETFRLQLADAVAIQETVTRLACQHFGADRCYYCEIERGQVIIRRDAAISGLPSVAGTYPLADFALLQAVIDAGRPFRVRDVRVEESVDDNLRQLCVQLQVISYLNIPVIKNGQPAGVLCLVQSTPRAWTTAETALAAEVAERAWAAVERARTEEALRASEDRFRAVANLVPDLLWRSTPDSDTDWYNQQWHEYTSQTLAEAAGYGWADAIHPDDRAESARRYRAAVASGEPLRQEHRIRSAQGEYRWFQVRARPFHNAQGDVTAWFGAATDIHARKQAELALAASEQRLRALVTNLPGAAAFVVGPDLRYQLAGGEALDAAGLTPADLLGRTVAEAMPPELVPQYETHYRQALAGQGFSLEHAAQGHTFISRGVPLPDAAGQPEAVLVVSYDITARKQAEEALRVSELKYRTLFESMDQGFGIGQVLPADEATGAPLDWQWLEVNPQFERLTGLPRADVLGHTARQLIHEQKEIWYERYAQAATGETVNFEAYSPVLDRWFDVYAFALGSPDNRRVAVLFSNVSEQKQVEAALREAEARHREQLEQQVVERTQQLQESRDLLQSVLDTSLISMSVLYAVRDEAGQVLDFRLGLVNKELERETGRTDLVGKLYAQEYPGIRQVGIFDLMLQALATSEPQGMEYFYDHEGFSRWFTCQFVKMGDGVAATNLDITERRIAEQERLKNLRLLEQAEAVAGLGSWDYDLATGHMRWSDGMYHLFALPMGSTVAPSHYLEAVLPDDRPRARQLVRRLTAGKGFEETLRLRVREQVKTVRMKAVVLRDETGQPTRVLGVDLDISELQRLEADNLQLRLGQQQALFEAVQAAQEEERRRMAESLHNGLGQVLFATKLQLDRLGAEPDSPARHEAARLLSDAIRQTRALSHELSPTLLEEFGLQVALETICRQLNAPSLHWHCHIVVADAVLPRVLQLAIYRLAQGLAHNVAQHAQASEATLEVEHLPGWIVLRVEDNGRGFDPATVHEGLGLKTLHSRAALLGGVVQLDSAPGQGTQVLVRLPVR